MLMRMRISHRLLLLVPMLLATLIASVWLGAAELHQSLLDDRKEAVKNLVQAAHGILDVWYDKEKSGEMTREAAQTGARNEMARLRFAGNNYFFIQRDDGVSVLALDRSQEGKNRIDFKSPDGVYTVRSQIEQAKHGGGFVYFRSRGPVAIRPPCRRRRSPMSRASIPGNGCSAAATTSTIWTPSTITSCGSMRALPACSCWCPAAWRISSPAASAALWPWSRIA